MIKGAVTASQKKTVTGKAIDAVVAVEGESLRDRTWLTAADVKALAGG